MPRTLRIQTCLLTSFPRIQLRQRHLKCRPLRQQLPLPVPCTSRRGPVACHLSDGVPSPTLPFPTRPCASDGKTSTPKTQSLMASGMHANLYTIRDMKTGPAPRRACSSGHNGNPSARQREHVNPQEHVGPPNSSRRHAGPQKAAMQPPQSKRKSPSYHLGANPKCRRRPCSRGRTHQQGL